MLLRVAVALFFTSLAVFATAERLGVGIPIPLEEAISRELARKATPEELNRRVLEALDQGDVSLARSFADLATERGVSLPTPTIQRLEDEEGPARTALRGTGQFLSGFATGSGEGAAGLAGSVISDFTVVGDVRDISREGGRMVAGEPYSRFLLGLSAVGIAATVATVATGGGGAPIRLGVSLLKAAWHGGTITAGMAVSLGRMLSRAVDFSKIGDIARGIDATSPTAIRRAAVEIGENVRPEVFAAVASDLAAVDRTVGAADTVKLLRYARSTEDLAQMPAFVERFGLRSRAVASLVGRASLRAFKTTVRVADFLLDFIVAVFAWFAGLAATMLWGTARRGLVGLIQMTSHRRAR